MKIDMLSTCSNVLNFYRREPNYYQYKQTDSKLFSVLHNCYTVHSEVISCTSDGKLCLKRSWKYNGAINISM